MYQRDEPPTKGNCESWQASWAADAAAETTLEGKEKDESVSIPMPESFLQPLQGSWSQLMEASVVSTVNVVPFANCLIGA